MPFPSLPSVPPPGATELRIHWKLGDGAPPSGIIGFDSRYLVDDETVSQVRYRPPGAVTIGEMEYRSLLALWQEA